MRAGNRSVLVEIMKPGSTRDDVGHVTRNYVLWRRLFAGFRAVRGAEQQTPGETQERAIGEFTFDYMDVGDRRDPITETMVIQVDGMIYNIVAIYPDLEARKDVRVVATQGRLPT